MGLYVSGFYFIYSILYRIYIFKDFLMHFQRKLLKVSLSETHYKILGKKYCKMGFGETVYDTFTTEFLSIAHAWIYFRHPL